MAIDPILPYKLIDEFGFKEHRIGIFFFHFTAVVVIVSLFFLLIPDKLNKVLLVIVGCFVSTVGAFLTGPSLLFGLPDKLRLISVGLIVSGIGKALIQSYAVSYIVTSGERAFPEDKEEVERKAPLMITVSFGVAAFLIPVLASGLFTVLKFRIILDIIGVLFCLVAISFLIHTSRNQWGRTPSKERATGEEDQLLIP